MPDAAAPRKPRRFWLFAPYLLVLIAFAAWSAYWVYAKNRILAELDAAAQSQAYSFSFMGRRIGGYPFRFELALDQARIAERSGWALLVPRLEIAAGAWNPGHAVLVAPKGVVLTRPGKGQILIEGQVLRASYGGLTARPRFSVEGKGLTMRPMEGARPMPFAAADAFELHLRPEAGDADRLFLGLTGASPSPGELMSRVTDGKSDLRLEATLSKASGFRGADWPTLLRTWSAAGGEMTIVRAEARVGQASISSENSVLGLEPDGRLHGKLALRLREGPSAMMALGAAGVLPQDTAAVGAGIAPKEAKVTLRFDDGETQVGPLPIGRAPKLY
jgi:hypothetical protein